MHKIYIMRHTYIHAHKENYASTHKRTYTHSFHQSSPIVPHTHTHTHTQVVLAVLMSRGIHVIAKSCTSAHIEANLAATQLVNRVPDGCLTDADGSEMVREYNT